MGKKKSFFKKVVKPFIKSNRTLLSGLAGVTSGIAIAGILGTDKAKEIVKTVEENVKNLNNKLTTARHKDYVS